MSVTYTKSLATDFPSGLASNILEREIALSTITKTLLGITTAGDVVDIIFDVALTSGEETELDNVIAAHTGTEVPFEEKYIEKEYDNKGHLVRHTCFARKLGEGNYDIKVTESTFVYVKNKLTTETETKYNSDGTTASTTTYTYFNEKVGSNTIVRREKS